jgi:hypothetical protein
MIRVYDVYFIVSIGLYSTGHWIGGTICLVMTLITGINS